MDPYVGIVRRLARGEGFVLDEDEFVSATACFPDQVCSLISAACAVATADACTSTLVDASDLLLSVHDRSRPEDLLQLHERLGEVTGTLSRVAADRAEAIRRFRQACAACADLDVGLMWPIYRQQLDRGPR
jgi:hypothetical protein